ncbi:MAG: tetratricopeptide repeat protein [Sphingobacteriales bacterium]|nr:MAG: tetratricopeptide repeat protein [Sphingobacteriales bacterium]
MFRFIFLSLILLVSFSLIAQQQDPLLDVRLGQQYIRQGEYEKAATIFEKLYEKQPQSSAYYRQYYQALLAIKDFVRAEELVKKQLKQDKNDPSLYVDLGLLLKNQNKIEEGEAEFEKALKIAKENYINTLAATFISSGEYNYAIKAYTKARELTKNDKLHAREIAQQYMQLGESKNAISAYLDYASLQPGHIQIIFNELIRFTNKEEDIEELQRQLYGRIQANNEELVFTEILIWAFYQQKDFEQAFIQVKALDKRLNEDGRRVLELARKARTEKQYDIALSAYEYVIAKGETNPHYLRTREEILNCRNEKIVQTDYSTEDLKGLETDYLEFLRVFGKNSNTISAIRDLAALYAYYLNETNPAITLLEEALKIPAISTYNRALTKLDLGDYYLMAGEIWEATLFYSQVDKDFKEDILGEEARYKNAKLSYFNGDFEWAQAQLNVLKASTSELIANDALKLSVFITDNLGLDTSAVPMQMYARAELLILQNKRTAAIATLDSVNKEYPAHALNDDILFARAQLSKQQRKYTEAAQYLNEVLDSYGTDILADDALFQLAELNENQFGNKEKAMEHYQNLLINYPGSLYVVEARKRYRKLRGDLVN